jgi:membrane fusion protein, multidrug efflux system
MIKRMMIMLVAVAVVFGGIFGFQVFKGMMIKKFIGALSNPPQTVSAAAASTSEWRASIEAIGSLRAVQGADLSLEVAGVVETISFNSGDDVQEGAILLRLRTADDVARLESLKAMAELNEITLDRTQRLVKTQAVSQAQLDTDGANLKNSKAQVAQQQAIVEKKFLRAPFAGHLGIRAVDIGQYVSAGTPIVTLQALDPIYVDFFVPQQAVEDIQIGHNVTMKVDAYEDQTFTGRISAINPKVDVSNRNVQVRATLKNPDHKLLPGMYATVHIAIGEPSTYVTLPQTAIAYNPYGNTVYVVESRDDGADRKPRLTARQTFVTVGQTRGDQVAILKGVYPGDMVVTAGQIKLHNGSVVLIDNSVTPTADAAPSPVDH